MVQSIEGSIAPLETPIEPLRWIGAYKLLKALLALLGALLVLRLMHRNLPDVALAALHKLHIEPHRWIGRTILHRILMVKRGSLGWFAVGLFAYVPLALAEGVGLILRRIWAEWLTIVSTAAMIPLEIYEVIRRPTWLRAAIFAANVLVLIYLIVRIRRDREHTPRLAPATALAQ